LSSKTPYLYILLLGIFYLIFPTHNANIDSWYYAASVKYNKELIHNHHLLYNGIGAVWFSILKVFKPDVEAINTLNIMNAVAATASLIICYKIFLRLSVDSIKSLYFSILCGVSFGFMRYATDAETYILPLLCSLASTYFYIGEDLKYRLLWTALFSCLAILIHQLHIWWTLAIFLHLVFQKPFKARDLWMFSLPLISIPVIYYIAYLQMEVFEGSFLDFLSGEYHKGNAGLSISAGSFLLTIVNLIRSFIQVHGQIPNIFAQAPIAYLLIGILTIIACFYLFKKRTYSFRMKQLTEKNKFASLFLTAFLLHLVFAFLSSGNAEFMVMLPFLMVFWMASVFDTSSFSVLPILTCLIFIWNAATGIVPSNLYDINRVDQQVEFTLRHPSDYVLWQHKPLVENIITYKKGFGQTFKFIRPNNGTQSFVDSLVDHQIPVYTDYGNPGTIFSREEMIRKDPVMNGRYLFMPQVTWNNIYGENKISLISKKGD
jgi:hypothetical protein